MPPEQATQWVEEDLPPMAKVLVGLVSVASFAYADLARRSGGMFTAFGFVPKEIQPEFFDRGVATASTVGVVMLIFFLWSIFFLPIQRKPRPRSAPSNERSMADWLLPALLGLLAIAGFVAGIHALQAGEIKTGAGYLLTQSAEPIFFYLNIGAILVGSVGMLGIVLWGWLTDQS